MNSKTIGDVTELNIMAYFISKDIVVSKPFGDNAMYDLIIDINSKLYRIQCKHGRVRNKCIISNTSIHNPFSKKNKSYVGKADYFAIFNETLNSIWLYPIDENTPKYNLKLRLEPPKNKQIKNITFAENYEADKILNQIQQGT